MKDLHQVLSVSDWDHLQFLLRFRVISLLNSNAEAFESLTMDKKYIYHQQKNYLKFDVISLIVYIN